MKIIKKLLILIILFVIVAAAYAWVGLFIPKNYIGIYYNTLDNNPQIIDHLNFKTWAPNRLFPNKTRLINLTLDTQTLESDVHFLLPSPVSFQSSISEADTNVKLQVKLLYSIDSTLLDAFIDDYYSNSNPQSGSAILRAIEKRIEAQIYQQSQTKISQEIVQYVAGNNPTTIIDNWNERITTIVQKNVIANLENVPIIVEQSYITTYNIPNIANYKQAFDLNNLAIVTSNDINPNSDNVQLIRQYLFLIRELSLIAKELPQALEIIKDIPPTLLIKDGFRLETNQ